MRCGEDELRSKFGFIKFRDPLSDSVNLGYSTVLVINLIMLIIE